MFCGISVRGTSRQTNSSRLTNISFQMDRFSMLTIHSKNMPPLPAKAGLTGLKDCNDNILINDIGRVLVAPFKS